MAAVSSLRLQDFAAFAPFEEIAKLAGIEIILHGGTAFRAALYAVWQDRLDADLFDLVPFNSDIDLEHGGPLEKTAEIGTLIDQLVPFASWCRWSINDGERAEKARVQRFASTNVPLRQIRFSTAGPADVSERALSDIKHRQVSFERNPRFGCSESDLRPDVEIFGLMMALNTWSEAEEIAKGEVSFEIDLALQWIQQGFTKDELDLLLERPALAARFWHLFSLRLARHGQDRFNLELAQIGQPILRSIGATIPRIFDGDRAFSVSRVTSSSEFRVPQLTPEIRTGEAAIGLFNEVIRTAAERAGYPIENLPDSLLDLIDPTLELVGIIPDLTLLPYGSSTEGSGERDDAFLSGAEQEFVQFAWDVRAGATLNSEGLTGQMLALGAQDLGMASALPVVGGTFGRSRAWVRVRLDDLIERGQNGTPVGAILLILQARLNEREETDGGPLRRQLSMPSEAAGYEDLGQGYQQARDTARANETGRPAIATLNS